MALILSIDTSSKNCSVSLAKNGKLIKTMEKISDSFTHAEKLHLFCKDLMKKSRHSFSEIDAYAFSEGPGSYTGLRIGAAAVKGFGFAFEKPIILVSTLKAMAFYNKVEKYISCPLIDSRIGEVYLALYDSKMNCLIKPRSHILTEENILKDLIKKHKIYFFGTGTEKVKQAINHKNAYFLNDVFPSSKYLIEIAEKKYNKKKFADISNFEPLYLKDFIPTIQKTNIL